MNNGVNLLVMSGQIYSQSILKLQNASVIQHKSPLHSLIALSKPPAIPEMWF